MCRDIKADVELADIFVVMLSGKKTTPDNQVEGLEQGADEYIVRPLSNRELLARVGAMLRIQRSEVRLRAKTHELQERVKELSCLFDISELLEKADTCLPEILQGTVVLIPPAWQYPEITCARILLDGQEYRTKNFRETAWKLARDILVRGEQVGRVEVGYLEERPGSDEGPFLHEERKLLNAIAERLGRVIERVRTEEALRQSQERYRAVSELTSDLAYAFRVEPDGTMVREWMTKALSHLTGFSSEELEAPDGWAGIIHPEDLPASQQHIRTLLSGKAHAYDLRIITKDGQVRWLRDSGHPVWDESQARVVRIYGAAQDITEQQETQEALRRYETIVATVSDPISYVDCNYRYLAVNETYSRYAKRPREEIVGLAVAELLGVEAFEKEVKPHLDRCFAGEEVRYQAWFDVPKEPPRCMDVGYYPVFAKDRSVVGAVVASRDITERQRAEEALRRERNLVARIMETSPVGIIVFDTQGTITYANHLVQELSALTEDRLVGLTYNAPLWHSVDKEGRPLPDEALPFAQVIRSGKAIHDVRFSSELPDGRWIHLSANAAPLYDESNRLDGVVVTVEEITERVQAEKQAEQAAATAERERLARDLHDAVTQTLFSVAAIAEALPRIWERDREEARRGLEELRRLTQGALAEMRTMLLELRPSALTEQGLGILLEQLGDAMMGRTRMPVITTVVQDCILPGEVQIALYRIAQEALNNIAKHARATQAQVHLDCRPEMVRLHIHDNGLGFDLEAIQPYQLGLGIMRERAHAIGAKITLQSKPGQGTEITVVWSRSGERDIGGQQTAGG